MNSKLLLLVLSTTALVTVISHSPASATQALYAYQQQLSDSMNDIINNCSAPGGATNSTLHCDQAYQTLVGICLDNPTLPACKFFD